MKITQIPLATLRLQYRIARAPLRFFEQRVLARVNPEAPARLIYERSVGVVDATVGNVLGDKELGEQGEAVIERSEALGEAVRLDEVAKQRRRQADAEFEQKQEKVAAAPVEARKTAERKADQARSAAEQRKQQAADAAAEKSAEAKQRIDEAAANKVTGVEAAKRAKQQTATAAEKAATAAAKAELDDAAEKRSEAVDKRAHADRVDELADAEKEQRQEARAED
jgi:hypothetical protein